MAEPRGTPTSDVVLHRVLTCGHSLGMTSTTFSGHWRCTVCRSHAVEITDEHKRVMDIVADGFRNLWTPYEIARRVIEESHV